MRIASAATACTRQFFMPGIARPAASTAQTTRSTRAGATIHPRRPRRVTAALAAGKLTVLMASLAPTTPKAASNSRRWSAKEGVRIGYPALPRASSGLGFLSLPDLPVRAALEYRPTNAKIGYFRPVRCKRYVTHSEFSDKSVRVLNHLVIFSH
jgi:hypothetical protein